MPLALVRHPRARSPGLSVGALGLVAGSRELYFASGPKILAAASLQERLPQSLAAASRARLFLPAKLLPAKRLRWRRRSAAEPLRACSVANSAALLRAVFVWTQPTIAPSSVSTLAANRWWLPNERRRLSPQQYSARLRVNQARSSSGWSWEARPSGAETRLQHQLLIQCRSGALDETCSTPANLCCPASWHACKALKQLVVAGALHTYQMAVQCLAAHQLRLRGCVIEPRCTTPASLCCPASWHACRGGQLAVASAASHMYQMVAPWAAHHDDVQRRRPRPQKNAQSASRTSTTRRRRSRAATSFTRPAYGS